MPYLPERYHHDGEEDEMQNYSHEECGDTRGRLFVTRKTNGYLHHCHNCAPKMSGFTRTNSRRTPEQIRRQLEKLTDDRCDTETGVFLPRGYTTDIPDRERLWLKRWLTDGEIAEYKIGYDERSRRIVLPIYDGEGDCIYWQARAIDGGQPKYLNPRGVGRDIYFAAGEREANDIVLVEAILSGIVVSRCGVYSVALMGSYIPPEILTILRGYENVYVWLDPDKKPDIVRSVRWLQRTLGKNVKGVFTERKPKEYGEAGLLREILQL